MKLNLKTFVQENKTGTLWGTIGVVLLALLMARIFFADLAWLSIALCVLLVAVVGLLIRENRKALTTRTAAFGINSLVTAILVIAIVGVINFLSSRYPQKLDLTANKLHSISDQTKKLVKGLDKEVKAVMFSKLPQREKFKPVLDNYEDLNPKFKVEFVDPDKEPTRAKQAGIKKYDTLVLSVGEKTALVDEPTEEKITNELIKLTKDKKQKICSIQGHGEKSFLSSEADGLDAARKGLEQQSYEIHEFNLPQEGKIPADCEAIALLGPTQPLFAGELKIIQEYLDKDGRALIAFDIDLKNSKISDDLVKLVESWGIKVMKALVVDPLSRMLGVDASVPILALFSKTHSITRDFKENVYFPFTIGLERDPNAKDLVIEELGKTTPKSWAETGISQLKTGGQVSLDPGQDKAGPITAAMAVERKKTRLVVFGTSQFANNNYSRFGGNMDLFLNAISWILEDENLISIRGKEETAGKVELSQNMGNFVFWLCVIILPVFVATSGIVVWVRRRRL